MTERYIKFRNRHFWVRWGISKGLALGFSINRYQFNADFIIFWIGAEW